MRSSAAPRLVPEKHETQPVLKLLFHDGAEFVGLRDPLAEAGFPVNLNRVNVVVRLLLNILIPLYV